MGFSPLFTRPNKMHRGETYYGNLGGPVLQNEPAQPRRIQPPLREAVTIERPNGGDPAEPPRRRQRNYESRLAVSDLPQRRIPEPAEAPEDTGYEFHFNGRPQTPEFRGRGRTISGLPPSPQAPEKRKPQPRTRYVGQVVRGQGRSLADMSDQEIDSFNFHAVPEEDHRGWTPKAEARHAYMERRREALELAERNRPIIEAEKRRAEARRKAELRAMAEAKVAESRPSGAMPRPNGSNTMIMELKNLEEEDNLPEDSYLDTPTTIEPPRQDHIDQPKNITPDTQPTAHKIDRKEAGTTKTADREFEAQWHLENSAWKHQKPILGITEKNIVSMSGSDSDDDIGGAPQIQIQSSPKPTDAPAIPQVGRRIFADSKRRLDQAKDFESRRNLERAGTKYQKPVLSIAETTAIDVTQQASPEQATTERARQWHAFKQHERKAKARAPKTFGKSSDQTREAWKVMQQERKESQERDDLRAQLAESNRLLEDQKALSSKQVSDLTNQLNSSKQSFEDFKSQSAKDLDAANKNTEAVRAQLAESNRQKEAQKTLAEATILMRDIELRQAKDRESDLQEHLRVANTTREALKRQHAEDTEKLRAQHAQAIKAKEASIAQSAKERDDLRAQLAESNRLLEDQKALSSKQVSDLTNQLNSSKQSFEEYKNAKESELSAVQGNLEGAQMILQLTESQKKDLERDLAQSQKVFADFKSQSARDTESLRAQHAQAIKERDDARADYARKKAKSKARKAQIIEGQKFAAGVQAQLAEERKAKEGLQAQLAQTKQSEENWSNLWMSLYHRERAEAAAKEAAAKERDDLRAQLAESNRLAEEAKRLKIEQDKKTAALQEQLAEMTQSKDVWAGMWSDEHRKHNELKATTETELRVRTDAMATYRSHMADLNYIRNLIAHRDSDLCNSARGEYWPPRRGPVRLSNAAREHAAITARVNQAEAQLMDLLQNRPAELLRLNWSAAQIIDPALPADYNIRNFKSALGYKNRITFYTKW